MKPISRARSIVRWVPTVVAVAAQIAAWTLFESGGLRSIPGWLALLTVVPLCGAITLYFALEDGDAMPLGGVAWQDGRAIARGAIVRNPDAARATLVTP